MFLGEVHPGPGMGGLSLLLPGLLAHLGHGDFREQSSGFFAIRRRSLDRIVDINQDAGDVTGQFGH